MIAYAATIALSAFLLFLVQPVIAKQILPWFGGSAAVWTTCMMFFQVVLLAGYAYSDALVRRFEPRRQRLVHAALLLGSLAVLPIAVDPSMGPANPERPVGAVLSLLAVTIGLPYFTLSTTGPLLQAWFTRQYPNARVYRLYALSNVASMLALIAYPPLIEPAASTRVQSIAWSVAYVLFVSLGLWVIGRMRAAAPVPEVMQRLSTSAALRAAPTLRAQLQWLVLSALGSLLLLSVTAHLTHNVAAVPLLWLLPLALYLLSFILCFDGRGWYRPRLFFWLAVLSCLLMIGGMFGRVGPGWRLSLSSMPIEQGIALYSIGLFMLCMYLHGELAARRPHPAFLTRFYLLVSLGGALGGVFAAMVAPTLFDGYYELPLALAAAAGVLLFSAPTERTRFAAFVGMACTASFAVLIVLTASAGVVAMERDFYGVLRVSTVDPDVAERARIRLAHGNTLHGEQLIVAEARMRPTTYFGTTSGVGRAIEALRSIDDGPQRIGVIGLGAGTLATYGRPGDRLRFYEIDPAVERLARRHFSFLSDSAAEIEVVLGDGRLLLERDPPQDFRLLVVDAFSSDSIPVHLLTAEAMHAYDRQVEAGGAIAFHVSNRYLDLAPVVRHLADVLGQRAIRVSDVPPADRWWAAASDWLIVTGNASLADALLASGGVEVAIDDDVAPWTDAYSNLFQVLKTWR